MSISSKLNMSLGEQQLAKLTSETQEIRMRALEQVETGFISCLQHSGNISFNPVLMLKQLIRWFGHLPLIASDRVLALMLELLRSGYGNVVMQKITYKRLDTELEKIRQILQGAQTKRVVELLDNLQSLAAVKYNEKTCSETDNDNSSIESRGSSEINPNIFSPDKFNLTSKDYEKAWSCPSEDDLTTLKTLMDTLTINNDQQLQDNLTNLQIKMPDYPSEYLLQEPHIFLQLLHLMSIHANQTLVYIDSTLITILKRLQRRLSIRKITVSILADMTFTTRQTQQLRVTSALGLLLYLCLDKLGPPLLEHCAHNWHLIELSVEIIRTFKLLGVPLPNRLVERLSIIVPKLINFCSSVKTSKHFEVPKLVHKLMIPRLESIIFNGLLLDVMLLNASSNPIINKLAARALLQPLIVDCTFLSCVPTRMKQLCHLCTLLRNETEPEEIQMVRLKHAYGLAISQLLPGAELSPLDLLQVQRQICLVLIQLSSESLLKLLIEALIKSTFFYVSTPEVRLNAESLLHTLFLLPNESMRICALRLLKQPVVEHYHAFVNGTNYLTGCSNVQLIKHHILGLPISCQLLRKLLIEAWTPQHKLPQLQQWCIDYLIMLLGLGKLVSYKDFQYIYNEVEPVLPLIVCRAIDQPSLQMQLWELLDPDAKYLDTPQMLRGNICYMFHPEENLRTDAIARVAYALDLQDHQNKYKPAMDKYCLDLIRNNICVIQPPVSYTNYFRERTNLKFTPSLKALLRLVQTPDLKPCIRRSTLIQLNVLLHDWSAVEAFTCFEGAYLLCLNALRDPLMHNRNLPFDDVNTLLPAVGILIRALFCSKKFRQEFSNSSEMLGCLMRCLFLMTQDEQLRVKVSTCIFVLLFHEHISATDSSLKLDLDLSAMRVPIDYELSINPVKTTASEGLAMQQYLLEKHFGNDESVAARHWRMYAAHKICGNPEKITLTAVHSVDMSDALKLTPGDLALVQASMAHLQLQKTLIEASNCNSHETLKQLIASIQLFMVLMRGDVPQPHCRSLWLLMSKYLRLTPSTSNQGDCQLYDFLLELCLSCLRIRLPEVLTGLSNDLETDPHHSFFMAMRDHNVSLHVLRLICECFVLLLRWHSVQSKSNWLIALFIELSSLTHTHFELRNLQHVRCMLGVLRQLCEHRFQLDDGQLHAYYQHFVQLSSNLRTSTQTGAQWQRDCLLIISQIYRQMADPQTASDAGNSKVLRYFLGLCGHSDKEVRALAWIAIADCIRSSQSCMSMILSDFQCILPGGLAACCLSTLVDQHEDMLIREFAGRVFELLMPYIEASTCLELLRRYSILQEASAAINTLHTMVRKTNDIVQYGSSCGIVACYISICVRQIILEPSMCASICEHAFINGLSDVIKLETPVKPHFDKYVDLCVEHIFKFYALCYEHNFEFLQRTICRDPVLLESFISLVNEVLDQKIVLEIQLIHIVKLLLVFCKDTNAYDILCEKFWEHPELLFHLLLYGLNQVFVNRTVQRYTLALLSLLLVKSHVEKKQLNLLRLFEAYVKEWNASEDEGGDNIDSGTTVESDEKENTKALSQKPKALTLKIFPTRKPQFLSKKPSLDNQQPKQFTNAACLLYKNLDLLFEITIPSKTYSFLKAPTKSQVQICEVLGNLLKLSPLVIETARQLKLLDRILNLLEEFLNDSSIGNATVYVRRVGAHKSRDIINNLLVFLNMLMHWHNTPHAIITDPIIAARMVRVLVRLWPWLSHSTTLKNITVRLTTLLTEHSFEMCKQTSQAPPGQSHSLLQLVVRVADYETTRKEGNGIKAASPAKNTSNSMIEAALRVMINCCSCAEGRLSLSKMCVLDMFDTLLPNTSSQIIKVKTEVLQGWLCFWEIFSRYEPGSKICHFQALLNIISRSPPTYRIRLCCLRILRNMCFCTSNRTQLIAKKEFTDVLRDIISQSVQNTKERGDIGLNTYEEHYMMVLSVWKIFGFCAKYKAMLRGTKLYKQLTILYDHIALLKKERGDYFLRFPYAVELYDLLEKLFKSLKS
ncbi:ana3 [Drosophila busckii]|uniref:Ana3 n=1 Tax=Drosophila busckii TaxID=30019 RepID=A0A0M4E807_DROBS|nr:uncharacterized protein LOC108597343 [Drosophila busckii]ALC40758.1 ana3 [Drosophila busckii]